MKKLSFYGLLAQAVEAMPEDADSLRFNRLETFAVIRDPGELNAENLEKSVRYTGTNYFYSRKWEKKGRTAGNIPFDFPVVTALEINGGQISDPLQEGRERLQTVIQLSALYPNIFSLPESHKLGTKLVMEDIYEKMMDHIVYLVRYATNVTRASVDGGSYDWYNNDYLTHLEGAGSSVIRDTAKTGRWKKLMQNANPALTLRPADDVSVHKLIGYTAVINLINVDCFSASSHSFDFSNCCRQFEIQ